MDHRVDDPTRDRLGLVQALTLEQGFIQAYAYAIVRDLHLAEDVYQEVAVILAQNWARVPPGLPRPWLKEVVRRKSLEVARRSRRHVLFSDETLELLAGAFDQLPAEDRQLREALADCVDKLPPSIRAVLESRYREDRSCDDIAARLGRSVQGVYAVLKRARATLADCIARISPPVNRGVGHD